MAGSIRCRLLWEGAARPLLCPPCLNLFLAPQFGDSQQLRLVRILRSTVMVRVGGGWMALDEFLVKNDPCRGKAIPGCFPTGAFSPSKGCLGSCLTVNGQRYRRSGSGLSK